MELFAKTLLLAELAILCKYFFYMSPDKNHIQRKLEKTLFERYQNNTAEGVDYLTENSFKNVLLLKKKNKSGRGIS